MEKRETEMEKREMDPLQVLEVQLWANAVHSELLMRYVANPANLPQMRDAVGKLFSELRTLAWAGSCPEDWDHLSCRCVPPRFRAMGITGGEEDAGAVGDGWGRKE